MKTKNLYRLITLILAIVIICMLYKQQQKPVPVPVPVPVPAPIGGCKSTIFGCCPNGVTPKINQAGSNC